MVISKTEIVNFIPKRESPKNSEMSSNEGFGITGSDVYSLTNSEPFLPHHRSGPASVPTSESCMESPQSVTSDPVIEALREKIRGYDRGGIHGSGHWERVLCFAEKILKGEGIESREVLIAALMHDIGREKDNNNPEHGERGARIARKILEEMNPGINIDLVCDMIRRHNDPTDGDYIELMILKEADRLDMYRMGPDFLDTSRLTTLTAISLIDEAKKIGERVRNEGLNSALSGFRCSDWNLSMACSLV